MGAIWIKEMPFKFHKLRRGDVDRSYRNDLNKNRKKNNHQKNSYWSQDTFEPMFIGSCLKYTSKLESVAL